jgi:cell division protein FtsQ
MQPKTRTALKRIVGALIWLAVLTGFVILLVAAVQNKDEGKCKGVVIKVSGDFIEEKDIRALIVDPTGTPIKNINLVEVEKMVARDPWVKTAQGFIDNQRRLNIKVTQRDPVARLFTNSGSSFYFDKDGDRIPVSARYAANVPVFTGFPTDAPRLDSADSTLAVEVRTIGSYVMADPFWSAQIEQVTITPQREFEMTPKLGDHVIVFGDGNDVDKKFSKLLAFYKEGLNKVGWNNYSRINVSFENEVVCTRRKDDHLLAMADSARRASGDSVAKMMIHSESKPIATDRPVHAPPAKPTIQKETAPGKREPKAVYRPDKKKKEEKSKHNKNQ